MKHKICILLSFILYVAGLMAAPAIKNSFDVDQPDGKILTVSINGDEYFHYAVTTDGIPVIEGENREFYYAEVREGVLVPSSCLAHNLADRSEEEIDFIEKQRVAVLTEIMQGNERGVSIRKNNFSKAVGKRVARKLSGERQSITGKKKGLVILVDFKDLSMKIASPNQSF